LKYYPYLCIQPIKTHNMKFYQNKTTGEIIGVNNMRELLIEPTEQSITLGYRGYSYEVIYDAVYPNKILGHGITSYCVSHSFLKTNYKRINKEIALKKHPDFKQYRHVDMVAESKNLGIDGIDVLRKQTI